MSKGRIMGGSFKNIAMKRRFKVRFHLGAGENFMKWRVENVETRVVEFFDPKDYDLELENCKLHNHPGAAQKIFDGENKTVCSWVMAKKVAILIGGKCCFPDEDRISYNPKIQPYWRDHEGNNIDKKEIPMMETMGRQLYTK
jgi:hypothetical protein